MRKRLNNVFCHAEFISASHEILKQVQDDRQRKIAFTLVEVLITLTIIGVIAAITIPNLMQSWRKHERITEIKTAYSIIQNATRMAVADYGNPDGWDFDGAGGYASTYFVPYVKIQKICGTGISSKSLLNKGCFLDNDNNGGWYFLNGNIYSSGSGYDPRYFYTLILQNGMHVAIWATQRQYINLGWARYIHFLVDVDGKKGPTTLGKDVFTFHLKLDTNKFSAGGKAPDLFNNTDCTLNGEGTSCAYIIERNHWEFPDNYPVKKF